MRIRAGAASAAGKRVCAQDYSKTRRNFYRLRGRVRGGGEAKSKTKELAEAENIGGGGPPNSGAEITAAPGNTKTTAPVRTESFGWQQAMLQSIAAFRP